MDAKVAPRTPNLRDARKSWTQSALRDAALQLFAAQGYDATSTEEIAEKAGVSPRTFFRYFPTKESVLFARKDLWFGSLAKSYCSQPTSLNDFDAMRAALIEMAPGLARSREMLRLYHQGIATSLALRGLRLDHQEQDSRDLAVAIAARRGLRAPDETCILLSVIGVMAHRRALDKWLAGPDDVELGDVIAEQFRLLALPFMPGTGGPASENRPQRTPAGRAASAAEVDASSVPPKTRDPGKRKAPQLSRRLHAPRADEIADEMDEAQRRIALEEIRALNRRVRSASRRQGLAGVSRLLRRTRNMKLIYERPPTK